MELGESPGLCTGIWKENVSRGQVKGPVFLAKNAAIQLELGLHAELGALLQLHIRHQLLVDTQVNGVFGFVFDEALVCPAFAYTRSKLAGKCVKKNN